MLHLFYKGDFIPYFLKGKDYYADSIYILVKNINKVLEAFESKNYQICGQLLCNSFCWEHTLKGSMYWFEVVNTLDKNKTSPEVIKAMSYLKKIINVKNLTIEDVL